MGLVQTILSKLECLYFHRIANKLVRGLYLDDGVIRCHIAEDGGKERSLCTVLNSLISVSFVIYYERMEPSFICGYYSIEIHVIFREGSRLIEATELNGSSNNNFILLNAVNSFLRQSLNRINNPKGHADGQLRWNCDRKHGDKLLNQILWVEY